MTDLEVLTVLLEEDYLSFALVEEYGLAALLADIYMNGFITLNIHIDLK